MGTRLDRSRSRNKLPRCRPASNESAGVVASLYGLPCSAPLLKVSGIPLRGSRVGFRSRPVGLFETPTGDDGGILLRGGFRIGCDHVSQKIVELKRFPQCLAAGFGDGVGHGALQALFPIDPAEDGLFGDESFPAQPAGHLVEEFLLNVLVEFFVKSLRSFFTTVVESSQQHRSTVGETWCFHGLSPFMAARGCSRPVRFRGRRGCRGRDWCGGPDPSRPAG